MTGSRRWPLHPAPVDGETLSSWLSRVAACYDTNLEGLGDDIGLRVDKNSRDDIDCEPPPGMIEILAERSGLTLDRLRQMSVAGQVPGLLDDMHPHPDGFNTYVRRFSVLQSADRFKPRQVSSWRPWLPPRLRARACPGCVANSSSPAPQLLLWAIPIVFSCSVHGCWLEEMITARGYVNLSAPHLPELRSAPEHVLALDRRTHDAFMTGQVELPGRVVHAGMWFRLLRTLIDELSCPLSESCPSTARTIKIIWAEAGHPTRDGQSTWHSYERQNETVQQHTMEAAAIAVTLLESGAIHGGGRQAALFSPVPTAIIFDSTPPTSATAAHGPVEERPSLMECFNAAIASARINREEARTVFKIAIYGKHSADEIHAVVNTFRELGISLDFHHAIKSRGPLEHLE